MAFRHVHADIAMQTLEQRLPGSAMCYNILQMLHRNLTPPTVTTNVYAFDDNTVGELMENSIFITIIQYRKVYNNYAVIISPPKIVTLEMQEAFEKLLDWSLSIIFCAFDASISEFVVELCSRKGQLMDRDRCDFMVMSNSKASAMNVDVPSQPGVTITAKELSPQDATLVAKRWTFASEGTAQMIADTIEYCGSAGVYADGELVSWVVIFIIGSINALYTEENQRGKGFGTLTMRKVCKIAGDKGLVPNVQIQMGNTASKQLMNKIGFEESHIVEWISYKPC